MTSTSSLDMHKEAVSVHNGIFSIPNTSSENILGSGSYGEVYRGIYHKPNTDEHVAIKVHHDKFLLEREVKIYT